MVTALMLGVVAVGDVLVFTRTQDYRQDSIRGGFEMLQNGWNVVVTEDAGTSTRSQYLRSLNLVGIVITAVYRDASRNLHHTFILN